MVTGEVDDYGKRGSGSCSQTVTCCLCGPQFVHRRLQLSMLHLDGKELPGGSGARERTRKKAKVKRILVFKRMFMGILEGRRDFRCLPLRLSSRNL